MMHLRGSLEPIHYFHPEGLVRAVVIVLSLPRVFESGKSVAPLTTVFRWVWERRSFTTLDFARPEHKECWIP